MKAAYWDDVARQLEMASKCHDVRLMYTIAKLTDEPKVTGTGAVRGRDGVLLTEPIASGLAGLITSAGC